MVIGCSKSALSENWDSSWVIWLQHAVSKNQGCLPKVTERAVEVRDKTCWITASILALVSEEVKDGLVRTDGSERHTVVARGREVLFCSCINFCSLRKTEISWPSAWQNSQWVPLEDWEVGRPEFIHGGAVNVAMGCGDGVANTWSDDDMWWVGRRFSSEMSSLTATSRDGP